MDILRIVRMESKREERKDCLQVSYSTQAASSAWYPKRASGEEMMVISIVNLTESRLS